MIDKKKWDKITAAHVLKRDKKCYTCGSKVGLQCGHYIPRAHMETRFSLVNCHAQCTNCNSTLSGNLKIYREKLIEEYGETVVKDLEKAKYAPKKILESDIVRIFYGVSDTPK